MPTAHSIEELKGFIGQPLGPSSWIHIDQDRINQFADVTGDHQFIHVDEQAASQVFGATIAHGFLTLSLIVPMMAEISVHLSTTTMGMNYGLNKLRFLTPVKVNSDIRANAKIIDVQEKSPNRYLITYEITVEIKGEEKPAYIAEFLTLIVTA